MLPKRTIQLFANFITDLISIGLSVVGSLALTIVLRYKYLYAVSEDYFFLAAVSLVALLLSYFMTDTSQDWRDIALWQLLRNRIVAGIIILSSFAVLIVATRSVWLSYRLFWGLTAVSFVLLSLLLRWLTIRYFVHHYKNSKSAVLTGVITVSARADHIIEALQSHWTHRLVGVALIDRMDIESDYLNVLHQKPTADPTDPPPTEIAGVPVKADYGSFIDWIRKDSLDEIFVDIPYDQGSTLLPFLEKMESMGIVVHINVPFCDIIDESPHLTIRKHLTTVGGKPMLTCAASEHNPLHLMLKRFIDFGIGLVGTILSAPIIALVAIPLLIESRGPLIFKQKRVGKNGRVFHIYKLRSMYKDAEERKKALMEKNEMQGFMFKMKDDPRITKVGKFIRRTSIDELPQFWNILLGDMSFVGTRPPTVAEYNQYHSHHKRRLSMKPGLTGLWQVSGRSDITDFEEVVRLDCQYIDNWSLWLDLKIMFKTVIVVFFHKGAE